MRPHTLGGVQKCRKKGHFLLISLLQPIVGQKNISPEALDLFVEALGAELGNVAVRAAATGGVWLTGSVARAIQPLLVTDRMRQAFIDKGAMTPLLRGIPVSMITLEDAGLLGAAVFAARA